VLSKLYRYLTTQIQSGRPVSPYLLEFLGALERTLAYAHTGNSKVLSNAVMRPLFLVPSLITMGFPTLNKAIYDLPFQNAIPFTIHEELWPLNRTGKGPAICTKRSQIVTYGEAHYMVSNGTGLATDRTGSIGGSS
jgi:hypothetical protein